MTHRVLLIAAAVSGLLAGGVAIHEWIYHRDHPYAPGPSLELALGFAAVAILAVAIGAFGQMLERARAEQQQLTGAVSMGFIRLRAELEDEAETRRAVAAMERADP